MDPITTSVAGLVIGSLYGLGSLFSSASATHKNISMQEQQLNYQKYLNNNQIKIQAADAQSAGINPLAMNSSSLSSGSYSNVSGAVADTSLLSSALASYAEDKRTDKTLESQKDISESSNDNQVKLAEINNKFEAEESAKDRESQERMNQAKLDQEYEMHLLDLNENKRQYNFTSAENTRQFNATHDENQRQFNISHDLQERLYELSNNQAHDKREIDKFVNNQNVSSSYIRDMNTCYDMYRRMTDFGTSNDEKLGLLLDIARIFNVEVDRVRYALTKNNDFMSFFKSLAGEPRYFNYSKEY